MNESNGQKREQSMNTSIPECRVNASLVYDRSEVVICLENLSASTVELVLARDIVTDRRQRTTVAGYFGGEWLSVLKEWP